jgi:voltage-dependent potassium channel beta subunit
MEYRFLGPTGLKVSAIGYGNWLNSNDPKNEEITYETIKKCWESGINFFDTAETYGAGQAEIQMGNAFKKLGLKREDIVVSTKIFWGPPGQGGANRVGLSRKRIIEGTNASLKRLQLDYVDIIFCHRFDYDTPLEETCRGFNQIINDGKAFYWGTSEWTNEQITAAIEICDKLNLIRPVVEQPQYNMFHRNKFEVEYGNLFGKYKMRSTIWSPLAGGLLTGKYLSEESAKGRFATLDEGPKKLLHYYEYFAPEKLERTREIFKGFEEIAKSLGGNITQLALAWVLRNKDVSSAICGFSSVSQVEDNLKALDLLKKFTPEIDEKLEKILNNKPETGLDYKSWKPLPSRREITISKN